MEKSASRIRLSVVALCFNHADFLDEALSSLEGLPSDQTQILVADDGSRDGSRQKLALWQKKHPEWLFFLDDENLGNCRRFNRVLAHCQGDWILDFATDDRIRAKAFSEWLDRADSAPEAGFCYADAVVFGAGFSPYRFSEKSGAGVWPEGNILENLFLPRFICPPAVLFRRGALQSIGGYREDLAYEDWDAWLRLGRVFPVVRHSGAVVEYRKHPQSLSASLYRQGNPAILRSTYRILDSALAWPEVKAVWTLPVIRYHLRLCVVLERPVEAGLFFDLLVKVGRVHGGDRMWHFWAGKVPGIRFGYRASIWMRECVLAFSKAWL